MARCEYCMGDMLSVKSCNWSKVIGVEYPDGTKLPAIKAKEKCHDCNVSRNGYHHPGCDQEICPKCKGQLISCGCLD